MKITDLRTGLPYPDTDWRSFHIGRPGIIVVYESLRQMPGKNFVILYHDQDVWDPNISYIRTSCGDIISETDSELLIRTNNSEYLFLKGDFGLDESRKNTLILNVLTN